jgi:hypothetical protein
MPLFWVVAEGGCRRTRLHHVDRPAVSARCDPKPHIDDVQEVSGEGASWGVHRREGLGQEEARPVGWEVGERLEHPSEQEGRLFERDILIEEMGQGIHEDDEADGVSGEQGRQAFTEQRRELPAGKRPREVEAPEEEVRGDAAGFGHGDDGHHLKGHVAIDECGRAPSGHGAGGTAEGHPVHGFRSPDPNRARLWGYRRHWAQGKEVRPGRRQRLGSRAVVHKKAIISTIC